MTQANEEKMLDILASMSLRMDAMEVSMNGKLESVEAGLNARLESVEASMNGKLESVESGLNAKLESIDNRLTKLEFKIETDVEVKLDALAEGHAAILEQLTPRSRIDDMENEIRFLKTVVQRVVDDMQRLQKAQ